MQAPQFACAPHWASNTSCDTSGVTFRSATSAFMLLPPFEQALNALRHNARTSISRATRMRDNSHLHGHCQAWRSGVSPLRDRHVFGGGIRAALNARKNSAVVMTADGDVSSGTIQLAARSTNYLAPRADASR